MKAYLGDGVYADFDGDQIILTTEDGIRETNRIYLDGHVFNYLKKFVDQINDTSPEPLLETDPDV
jgi:hypothetical protein